MSSLIVKVCKIDKIDCHPRADRLDIVRIKGWQIIAQKGLYKEGEIVVYVPPDNILPKDLSDKMDVTKYLSDGRLCTLKIRGVYSQGLIVPLRFLPSQDVEIGDAVENLLRITKYIPNIPENLKGKILDKDPRFIKYTDMENIKNYPDVLKVGELVQISEKIFGTNCRIANIDGQLMVGSFSLNLKQDNTIPYWQIAEKYNLKNILKPGQQLFGEVYGSVAILNYGIKDADVRFFDLVEDNNYVPFNEFKEFCEVYSQPIVPILYEGEWDTSLLKLADGKSEVYSGHIKEGIVIKSAVERWDEETGRRIIYKHLSDKFLSKNYGDIH